MADIFISYARSDRDLAVALSAFLEQEGFTVWWDAQMVAGQGFSRAIREQIDAAQALIVIWTPASVRSEFVEAEAAHALHDDKAISTRTEETPIRDLPFPFPRRHTDLIDDRAAILRALDHKSVTRSAAPSAPPAAPNAPPTAPTRDVPTLIVDPFPGPASLIRAPHPEPRPRHQAPAPRSAQERLRIDAEASGRQTPPDM